LNNGSSRCCRITLVAAPDYREDDISIELDLGGEAITESLMLHVRGNGAPLAAVRRIADALECPAFDCTTGEYIEFDDPHAVTGFDEWRCVRDKVIGAPHKI
jgi:hypothetical protein